MNIEFKRLFADYYKLPLSGPALNMNVPESMYSTLEGPYSFLKIKDPLENGFDQNRTIQQFYPLSDQPFLVNRQTAHKTAKVIVLKRENVMHGPKTIEEATLATLGDINHQLTAGRVAPEKLFYDPLCELNNQPIKSGPEEGAYDNGWYANVLPRKDSDEISLSSSTTAEKLKGHPCSTTH